MLRQSIIQKGRFQWLHSSSSWRLPTTLGQSGAPGKPAPPNQPPVGGKVLHEARNRKQSTPDAHRRVLPLAKRPSIAELASQPNALGLSGEYPHTQIIQAATPKRNDSNSLQPTWRTTERLADSTASASQNHQTDFPPRRPPPCGSVSTSLPRELDRHSPQEGRTCQRAPDLSRLETSSKLKPSHQNQLGTPPKPGH